VVRSPLHTERPQLRLVPGGAESVPRAPTDDELIDAFERGDADVPDLLYERLEDAVAATLIKVLGRRDQEYDDLVQTTFEQLLLTLARRSFARSCSLKSWAISIATHVALNAIRKRRSERRHIEQRQEQESQRLEVASRAINPERATELAALREELGRISPITAQVVVLHEVMGCGLAEVAALMGLSPAAAQSRLVRGRAELRERLEAQESRSHDEPRRK
jgi:RNA polymerase sigma-70 factor, ECF subfamily